MSTNSAGVAALIARAESLTASEVESLGSIRLASEDASYLDGEHRALKDEWKHAIERASEALRLKDVSAAVEAGRILEAAWERFGIDPETLEKAVTAAKEAVLAETFSDILSDRERWALTECWNLVA